MRVLQRKSSLIRNLKYAYLILKWYGINLVGDSWIRMLKKKHSVVSRKVTKFVATKTRQPHANVAGVAAKFMRRNRSLFDKIETAKVRSHPI